MSSYLPDPPCRFGSSEIGCSLFTMYTHRWPWTPHRCQNVRTRSDGSTLRCVNSLGTAEWAIQCWNCDKYYCEQCTCDTCDLCGQPTCPDCRGDHIGKCAKSWEPFLEAYPHLQCTECDAPVDVANHCCQNCQQPQCLQRHCAATITTCYGPCHRDICGRSGCRLLGFGETRSFSYNSDVMEDFATGNRVNESLPVYIVNRQRFCRHPPRNHGSA